MKVNFKEIAGVLGSITFLAAVATTGVIGVLCMPPLALGSLAVLMGAITLALVVSSIFEQRKAAQTEEATQTGSVAHVVVPEQGQRVSERSDQNEGMLYVLPQSTSSSLPEQHYAQTEEVDDGVRSECFGSCVSVNSDSAFHVAVSDDIANLSDVEGGSFEEESPGESSDDVPTAEDAFCMVELPIQQSIAEPLKEVRVRIMASIQPLIQLAKNAHTLIDTECGKIWGGSVLAFGIKKAVSTETIGQIVNRITETIHTDDALALSMQHMDDRAIEQTVLGLILKDESLQGIVNMRGIPKDKLNPEAICTLLQKWKTRV